MSPRREVLGSGAGKSDADGTSAEGAKRLLDARPEQDRLEHTAEGQLRPWRLSEFIGQSELVARVSIVLEAARLRGETSDHFLFGGPPGLGKTSLASLIANEMGTNFRVTAGPALVRQGDLAAILSDLREGDVFFIDEIHRIPRNVEEMLYIAMEDYKIDILVGKGPTARSVRLDLEPFTLVGATTRVGMLTGPLRDRFGVIGRLEFYSVDELTEIIFRSARILGIVIEPDAAGEIARRSRGTPRLANRLLKRVRDFAAVAGCSEIGLDLAREGLEAFGVDELGLDHVDLQLLGLLCNEFAGRAVGIASLAVSLGEDRETVEDFYEPYLVQKGMVLRTPRGRVASERAYRHLGLSYVPDVTGSLLFDISSDINAGDL